MLSATARLIPLRFLSTTRVPLRSFSSSSCMHSSTNIDALVKSAAAAFPTYKQLHKKDVSSFLETIAKNLEDDRPQIVNIAHTESHLPVARCEGELTRTTNQIRLFAKLVDEGSWVDARIDGPVRSMLVPIGPVAVFGASNFPLAFSTLGGDTISALAAGCPVVYKTHPGHPQTTQLCNAAIQKAIKSLNFPAGIFQITPAMPHTITMELVEHPLIEAVGFTGSQYVGTLINRAAANRPKPIPAYCEMGSVNPLFVFSDALKTKSADIAKGLAGSVTLGSGQFCTNPGLVFLFGEPPQVNSFISSLIESISAIPPQPMLTTDIQNAYKAGINDLAKVKGVNLEYHNKTAESGAAVFSVSSQDFFAQPHRLQQEVFGPSTLVVKIDPKQDLSQLNTVLEGQLTATFHATETDTQQQSVKQVISSVSEHVGRIVWGGYPTGVEVNSSIQHGGPWPASSDGRTTSVGTRAIFRWVRPIAFQNYPENLLPPQLSDANPYKITRLVSGKLVT